MRLTVGLLALSTSVGTISLTLAQSAAFDIASVKVNRSGQPFSMGPLLQPGGFVRAINLSLLDLIRAAYGLEENQIVSTANLEETNVDVEARTTPTATAEDAAGMLRMLLADRFGLKTHPETRSLPVYTLLRVSKTTLGPGMKAAGDECAPLTFPGGGDALPPPPPPPPGMEGTPIGARLRFARCPAIFFPGGMSARAIDMPAFASALARFVHRPVIDRTGLTGAFDLDVHYAPDYIDFGPTAQPTNAPSLVTALREQLGLRLDSTRAPVDVLVVDRVQPPSDN